ncbi:MAG: hypothetical protein ABEL76_03950, partial [Bradymonadaceae bacterium]
ASLLPAVARFYELARTYNHWIATVPDFTRFASARFDSTITSSWDPQAGRLKATVTVPDAPILRTGDDPPTIGVALPAASPGGRLASVEIDGSHRPASELRATGPGYERVVPLDPGEHRLIATYEPIESAR